MWLLLSLMPLSLTSLAATPNMDPPYDNSKKLCNPNQYNKIDPSQTTTITINYRLVEKHVRQLSVSDNSFIKPRGSSRRQDTIDTTSDIPAEIAHRTSSQREDSGPENQLPGLNDGPRVRWESTGQQRSVSSPLAALSPHLVQKRFNLSGVS